MDYNIQGNEGLKKTKTNNKKTENFFIYFTMVQRPVKLLPGSKTT